MQYDERMSVAAQTTGASSGLPRALPAPSIKRFVPNALTVLRVVLAAAFFVILSIWPGVAPHEGRRPPGVGIEPTLLLVSVIFIVAALTDALDGWLSRKWNVTSAFGRVMDPFADKVLVIGAFVFLAGPGFRTPVHGGGWLQVTGVLPWMVIVVMARELLVTSIRGVVEGRGGKFGATFSGKAKMIVQAAAVPTVLATVSIFDVSRGSAGRTLVDGVVWATVVVTVLSGLPYVVRGVAALRDAHDAGHGA